MGLVQVAAAVAAVPSVWSELMVGMVCDSEDDDDDDDEDRDDDDDKLGDDDDKLGDETERSHGNVTNVVPARWRNWKSRGTHERHNRCGCV